MRWIKPSKIDGRLDAPPSKSMMLRATAAAVLSLEETVIRNPSFCDDALAGLHIAESLGCQVKGRAFGSPLARVLYPRASTAETDPQTKPGAPAAVESEDREVRIKSRGPLNETRLNCRESGLCLRMFTPIAALFTTKLTLLAEGSLLKRPMRMMEEPLSCLGGKCETSNGFPPVHVEGPLQGGNVTIDGSLSSQFLTGLLFALPFCPGDSEIRVRQLKSGPYAVMTLQFLRAFGVSIAASADLDHIVIPGRQRLGKIFYDVEGDWSAAAFLLVAGAICGKVEVCHLPARSLQPDRRILEALEQAGATISVGNDGVSAELNVLKGFDFDATDCPDLVPPLAALACHCSGRTRIFGAHRLKHKESDRATALLEEFSKAGARIAAGKNCLEIRGGPLRGAVIDSRGDHRIAMAGAVAALRSSSGLEIDGWECVAKSYPAFFEDLKSIGGIMT